MQGTQDANAAAPQILRGYSAYVKGEKVNGSMNSLGAQIITPGTANKTIAANQYLSGVQTIAGDPNLVAANIAKGKSIFGVAGNLQSQQILTGNVTTKYIAITSATQLKKELFATINNVPSKPNYIALQCLSNDDNAGIEVGNSQFHSQLILMADKYLNLKSGAYKHNYNSATKTLPSLYFTYDNNTVTIYGEVSINQNFISQRTNWSYLIV